MPEGPEIRRAADLIERALAGRIATEVHFAFPRLAPFARRLAGKCVDSVETRGKAMLIHFEGGLSIYSHSQLYGRWFVVRRGAWPRTGRRLRLAIHNEEKSALLYSASEIEVLPRSRLGSHPFLARLGPDVLDPELSDADLLARITERRFAGRPLHALLLDQGFVAGVGNYLRSEILFAARLHPARTPGELSEAERIALADAIRSVTTRAYRTGGVTNDPQRVERMKAAGRRRSEYRHQVFTRGGQRCFACRATVERHEFGGRKLFLCPRCQPLVRTERIDRATARRRSA